MKQRPASKPADTRPTTRRGRRLGLAGVLLLLGALFGFSVLARQDRFGDLEGRGHEWLTGSAVKFTRNWYREGAWHLHFAMLENPRSIEFPDLRSREPYVSYPVGCLLPVHALARLAHREPSPGLVMSVDLAGQCAGAFLVFAILMIALEGLDLGWLARLALALLGFLFWVFLPGPFYWLQNVYFSDQAILPWVLLAILFELLHERSGDARWEIAQSLAVGWGLFTDWLMVPFAAALLVVKWTTTWRRDPISARSRRAILWLVPAAIALLVFAIQVASLEGFAILRHKLLARTGVMAGASFHFSQLYDRFFLTYVPRNFGGAPAPWLLALSAVALAALAVAHRGRGEAGVGRALRLGFLLLVPPTLHCLVLWQHSVDHSFTPLRFLPAFACLPFALLPALVARAMGLSPTVRSAIALAMLVVGVLFLGAGRGELAGLERARRPEIPALGASLARLTRYEDVVFSPDFEVPINPPELLSYSMKRVDRVASPESLGLRLSAVPDRARVRLVFLREPDAAWARRLQGTAPRDDGMVRAYDLGAASALRASWDRGDGAR